MQRADYFYFFSDEACWSPKFYNSAKFWLGVLPGEAEKGISIAGTGPQDVKEWSLYQHGLSGKGRESPSRGGLMTGRKNAKVLSKTRHGSVNEGLL